MASSSGIYKLHVASRRRPYVLSGAPEPSYHTNNFNGRPLPEDWQPPTHEVHGTSYRLSDAIAWRGPHPLLSERSVDVFQSVAPGCAEYKFFTHIKGRPYYVLNVLAAEDILDEARSEVTRAASGQIITVVRYAFKSTSPAAPLFKLPDRFDSDTLCTEAIPAAVVRHKLTGFSFRDPSVAELKDLFLGKDTNCYPGVGA